MKKSILNKSTFSMKHSATEEGDFNCLFSVPNKKKCMIYQDSKCNIHWQVFTTGLLIFVCVILPLHIAFSDESPFWCHTYNLIDFIFLIDLCMQFFMTIPETETTHESADRKMIALGYLKGWFVLDLMSIMPFDTVMNFSHGDFWEHGICPAKQINQEEKSILEHSNLLLKAPKIGKIFRIVRLLRLVKIFKLVKSKENLQKELNSGLQISAGMERLTFLILTIIYFQHVCSCFWLMIGQDQPFSRDNWMNNSIKDLSQNEQYMTSFYFVVTTMTTVGYGDMSASTVYEQIYIVILMMCGVFVFSLVTGSVASILASMDVENAHLTEKLTILARLANRYDLPKALYSDIKKTLKFDTQMATEEMEVFVQSLPHQLRNRVAYTIHYKTFTTDPFFKQLGHLNKRLLSFFGQRFRTSYFCQGQYLHREGDEISTYKVCIKGAATFVQPTRHNQIYALVNGVCPDLEDK